MRDGTHLLELDAFADDHYGRIAVILLIASLAGLPPTLGFWTKLALLLNAGALLKLLTIVPILITLFVSIIFYMSVLRYTGGRVHTRRCNRRLVGSHLLALALAVTVLAPLYGGDLLLLVYSILI